MLEMVVLWLLTHQYHITLAYLVLVASSSHNCFCDADCCGIQAGKPWLLYFAASIDVQYYINIVGICFWYAS